LLPLDAVAFPRPARPRLSDRPPLVLGASVSVAFVVLTQEVADVEADERGLASDIFETPATSSAARSAS
jgi:hypothetical protein